MKVVTARGRSKKVRGQLKWLKVDDPGMRGWSKRDESRLSECSSTFEGPFSFGTVQDGKIYSPSSLYDFLTKDQV